MSDDIIKRIYEARVKAYADPLGLRVQYENEPFDPPNAERPEDNVYLRCFVLPARTTSDDLAGDHRGYRGVVQIDIVIPVGVGTALATTIKQSLHDLFSMNLPLTDTTGLEVQIVTPLTQGRGLPNATEYTIPMSFAYRSDPIG